MFYKNNLDLQSSKKKKYAIYIAQNFQIRKKVYSWTEKKRDKIYEKNGIKGYLEILGARFTELKY